MSADDYKDYLLGLVFFKNLSDEILYEVVDLVENRKPESLEEAQKIFERYYLSEDKDLLEEEIRKKFGCFIKPESTFSHLAKEVADRTFMLSSLSQIFRDIEQSQGLFYEGLFEDFDINSKKLGKTAAEANKLISSVIIQLADIDFHSYGHDALGDAYEYLISKFASESGKKKQESFTPLGRFHVCWLESSQMAKNIKMLSRSMTQPWVQGLYCYKLKILLSTRRLLT